MTFIRPTQHLDPTQAASALGFPDASGLLRSLGGVGPGAIASMAQLNLSRFDVAQLGPQGLFMASAMQASMSLGFGRLDTGQGALCGASMQQAFQSFAAWCGLSPKEEAAADSRAVADNSSDSRCTVDSRSTAEVISTLSNSEVVQSPHEGGGGDRASEGCGPSTEGKGCNNNNSNNSNECNSDSDAEGGDCEGGDSDGEGGGECGGGGDE